MATITEGAGMLIAAVRILVRDAIATCVSRLIVYAAEEAFSLGVATPLVVEQMTTLVASWAGKIARWLKALLASLRQLIPSVHRLGELIEELKKVLSRLRGDGHSLDAPASDAERATQTGGEFRRPRNDFDFEVRWADDAYDRIRATDNDIAAIAATAKGHGFSHDDIGMIKNHVFRDEHLLGMYPPAEMTRFDANPRMAEAWIRLTEGRPHPSDFDLLQHERFEAQYMRDTGNPSYSQAHSAAIQAGYTWDPEAAAADGLGYQLSQ